MSDWFLRHTFPVLDQSVCRHVWWPDGGVHRAGRPPCGRGDLPVLTHHQQDGVWPEGLGPQTETLPHQEHGSGQQRLPGEQSGSDSRSSVSALRTGVLHSFHLCFVSCGSLTVRECWSSTLWVSTPFRGWIPTTRRPPLYPWRATAVCREKRRCGCWMTTATRCSYTTLHPTNSVHSTGEWCSGIHEHTEPRLGLQTLTRSRTTEIEVVHHHWHQLKTSNASQENWLRQDTSKQAKVESYI